VIFAEHAEAGGNAASIARHAMETYFAKLEGRPLPPAPQPPAPESATSEALVAAAAHPLEETP
jgi:hypothetical protein